MELANRVIENDFIKVTYSFCEISIPIRDGKIDIDRHIYIKTKDKHYATLYNIYLSNYNRISLASGIEEIAKRALRDYINDINRHINSINELIE